MYSTRRKVLSQNFFYSRKLVRKLVRLSSIGLHDRVIDIGAGRGILTEELLKKAKQVIAIEIDSSLYFYLQKNFSSSDNLALLNADFLTYTLPQCPYKVFANAPFSIEGIIIRRLLTADVPPDDSYLVVRQDLAERLSGMFKECQFSISYKPWFTFKVLHRFRKNDFEPVATMDAVFFQIMKNKYPLLEEKDKKKYMKFIEQGFGGGKYIRQNLRRFFTYIQLKRLAQNNNFSIHSKPSDLTLENWIELYSFAKSLNRV